MAFLYAFLIGGLICALTQFLTEIKISFPLVAILLIAIGGGVLTKLGVIDFLNSLGAGGVSVTALGCGNAAYSAGATLVKTGSVTPLILVGLLNIILIALGAACGSTLFKKFSEAIPASDKSQKNSDVLQNVRHDKTPDDLMLSEGGCHEQNRSTDQ
ncbi:SpoVA/SpoVAEb family sporulation membrane protein [Clostridium sp. WLY-B-L2]|uniref:SpoVA/SpoVAEb family sporulation membrane protein n=1 Tax=Clostridium aromativorans TaxID=2836848 RepID=A0ABS8N3Q5_9CLOT|nr:SpoVA/SpoVAEb family sporulation membrane protein [Clostridium aromativorans]MCC9294429.1 SpoVA/SpoVAEb family sporulation membrane protein [Clostridium aromativorans]